MQILFISDYLPYPLIAGDRVRVYNLMRRIAKEHDLSFVGFIQTPDEEAGVAHMKEFCERVEAIDLPHRSKLSRLPRLLRHGWQGVPLEFEFLHSRELERRISRLMSTISYDIVHIEQTRMAPYLKVVRRAGGARVVLGFDNVGTYQYSRISRIASTRLERTRAWVHSRMLRCWEPRFAEHFDRCIVVSEIDRKLLLEANPNLEIDVVPNGVDTEIYRAMPYGVSARALLFIGNMAYAPCADGALWFCNEILPRIRKVVPGVEVWIVGNSPPREVAQLEGEGVHVTGRVGSVQAYYEASAVSVVPIRAGGGTRLKILESMALGRPVVSTTVGCEGIDVEPGKHLLIGDTAERFADQVLLLLSERDLWEGISRRGREFVVREHDWNLIGNRLLEVYAEVAGSRGAWGFEKTQRGMGLEKCM